MATQTQAELTAATTAATFAYQDRMELLRERLSQYIERVWRSLGEYRNPQMKPFANLIIPAVLGAQQQAVALTSSSLAQQKQIALGGRFTPAAVDPRKVSGSEARNGADMNDVYGRPFHLVWRQLDELPRIDGSIDQAIESGMKRAVDLALTDVQLAKRAAAHQVLSADDRVVGYRRVLEGIQSCGLCLVAATVRYHKEDLLPIHGGCDCSTEALYGTGDPGQTVDVVARQGDQLISVGELDDVHARIAERFGNSDTAARRIPGAGLTQYQDALIVHEHGELGPVLSVRGEAFLGPDDI